MSGPNPTKLTFRLYRWFMLFALLLVSLASVGCSRVTKGTAPDSNTTKPTEAKRPPPAAVPMWLGNLERNFFGTGPWTDKPLEIAWDFKTGWVRGRLHPDPWGGSGWPGQVAVVGDRVYFQSADSYVYCLNRSDASVIWKFQTTDCAKSAPSVSGDRLVVGNLDHYVYCLDTNDGSLVWKYQTGFETDSSSAIIGDRVYVGGEDHYYYCFNLADGKIIFKTDLHGSIGGRHDNCRWKNLCRHESGRTLLVGAESCRGTWRRLPRQGWRDQLDRGAAGDHCQRPSSGNGYRFGNRSKDWAIQKRQNREPRWFLYGLHL
jgi:hypothetical protein